MSKPRLSVVITTPMASRPLLLLVSELAALAGRHRYKPRAEAVINHLLRDKVWVKRVREQYLEEQVITQPNCELLAAMVAERHAGKVVLQDDVSFLDQFAALSIKYPDVKQEFDALARPEVDVKRSHNRRHLAWRVQRSSHRKS